MEAGATEERSRIVWVSGDLALYADLAHLLRHCCSVVRVDPRETAGSILQLRLPDLIVVAGERPGPDAAELCACLRSLRPSRDIPIVVVSGSHQPAAAARAFAAGATDYLPRPYRPGQLRARILIWLLRRERPGRPRLACSSAAPRPAAAPAHARYALAGAASA